MAKIAKLFFLTGLIGTLLVAAVVAYREKHRVTFGHNQQASPLLAILLAISVSLFLVGVVTWGVVAKRARRQR